MVAKVEWYANRVFEAIKAMKLEMGHKDATEGQTYKTIKIVMEHPVVRSYLLRNGLRTLKCKGWIIFISEVKWYADGVLEAIKAMKLEVGHKDMTEGQTDVKVK